MNDVAIKVLKGELEPELLAKFNATLVDLQKDGEALDPSLKNALKGLLQMYAAFKDKLKPEQLQAMAHLVGFTGNMMSGSSPSGDDSTDTSEDGAPPAGDEDPAPNPFGADATGKDGDAPPKDPDDQTNKPNANPFGKKGDPVNKAFEEFKKKADAEAAELRKGQEELRKQNEAIRFELRKKEVSDMVAKKYPNLGSNAAVTDMVLGLEKQGLLGDMEQKLAAWNNQLGASSLFKEMGAQGDGEDATPEQHLNKKADELRKQHPGMSQGVAYTKAYDANPELANAIKKRDAARRQG